MNDSDLVSHVWKNLDLIQKAGEAPIPVLLEEEGNEKKDFHTRMSPYVYGIPQADIILGSELTYNTLSITTVPKVISKFLSPEGVFYEILSDDRDGVGSFLVEMKNRGFSVLKERFVSGFLSFFIFTIFHFSFFFFFFFHSPYYFLPFNSTLLPPFPFFFFFFFFF